MLVMSQSSQDSSPAIPEIIHAYMELFDRACGVNNLPLEFFLDGLSKPFDIDDARENYDEVAQMCNLLFEPHTTIHASSFLSFL